MNHFEGKQETLFLNLTFDENWIQKKKRRRQKKLVMAIGEIFRLRLQGNRIWFGPNEFQIAIISKYFQYSGWNGIYSQVTGNLMSMDLLFILLPKWHLLGMPKEIAQGTQNIVRIHLNNGFSICKPKCLFLMEILQINF